MERGRRGGRRERERKGGKEGKRKERRKEREKEEGRGSEGGKGTMHVLQKEGLVNTVYKTEEFWTMFPDSNVRNSLQRSIINPRFP